MQSLDLLTHEMIQYYKGDPKRIQHFIKVHSFARLIGVGEKLSPDEQFQLEAAALVHDIGIRPAEEKFGSCTGKLQEQEGPEPARKLLFSLGFDSAVTERICFLVAHHHTYDEVDGLDYRILLEADFLTNLYEDGASIQTVQAALKNIFRTKTGAALCRTMFGID